VYEKHCIIREYLEKNGVSAPTAEEDACRMEHLLSDETFQMMKKFLGK
jgi:Mn-dependent DtxR family transcriptional regulator